MANSDQNPSPPSDLQAMLARLRGTASGKPEAETKKPEATAAAAAVAPPAAKAVVPAAPPKPAAPAAAPAAVATKPVAPPVAAKPAAPAPAAVVARPAPAAPAAPAVKPAAASANGQVCSFCKAPRKGAEEYCESCGFVFPPAGTAVGGSAAPSKAVKGRYEVGQQTKEFGGVSRHKGTDRGAGEPVPVIILRQAASGDAPAGDGAPDVELVSGDAAAATAEVSGPAWPSVAWEKNLLEKAASPVLPKVLDHFTEDGYEYLIEEDVVGQSLWNAWDDLDSHWSEKFGWLKDVAEALNAIHKGGAIIEGCRPDIVTVPPVGGHAILSDLSDLIPLPLPANVPIRGSHYTAPELAAMRPNTDARADMYSFGAMLYALHLGRELTDQDFEKNGLPKHFIARFPDVHPLYGRLVLKTFLRDVTLRFPTDEAGKKDATGFTELINILDTGKKMFGHVRMEVAAWTTTGIVRTNNEDALSIIHAAETRLDDVSEYILVLMADGMGGYEAGEIAAALCLDSLREILVGHPIFAAVAGKNHPRQQHNDLDVAALKKLLHDAMKETNKRIFQAPAKGIGRRGMGCTCEVVYMDGYNIVVGHVGDSRTYHLQQGRLNQITRDQTLVNRLVELGQISAEEAENHPRKNELQQAMGGRAEVEPATYSAKLRPTDWVLVTTDGLINHIKNDEIQEMFQLEAQSAEMSARRLVNFANLRGATDNSTVVIVRCT